jgi:lysophospholipase L1-like esterase
MVAKPSANLLRKLDFSAKTVIVNCAYSGDVITTMSKSAEDPLFFNEMKAARYDAILLSGGGNDLINALQAKGNRPGIIRRFSGGDAGDPASYVNPQALADLLGVVTDSYARIVKFRDATGGGELGNAGTPIVLHTYDYPTARNAPAQVFGFGSTGPWLIKALAAVGVPVAMYEAITRSIYTQLAATLSGLANAQKKVYVVPTCGTLRPAAPNTSALSGDWINEIHPSDDGYALLSAKISAQLHALGLS